MLTKTTTEKISIMTLKGDAIFKEKLTGGLKNDIRNSIWLIFMAAVASLKTWTVMGWLCPNHIKF